MNDDDRRDDEVKIERDHPQTRKGEDDARGSAEWNDDVADPEALDETGEGERRKLTDEAMSRANKPATGSGGDNNLDEDEAEAVRAHAGRSIGDSIGGGAGGDTGSGTPVDTGGLGGGGQGVGNHPGGTWSPGGDSRR